jgi:hypothetical protein
MEETRIFGAKNGIACGSRAQAHHLVGVIFRVLDGGVAIAYAPHDGGPQGGSHELGGGMRRRSAIVEFTSGWLIVGIAVFSLGMAIGIAALWELLTSPFRPWLNDKTRKGEL